MRSYKNYKKIVSVLLTLTMILTLSQINISAEQQNYQQITKYIPNTLYKGTELNIISDRKLDEIKIKSKLDSKLLKLVDKQSVDIGKTKEMLKTEMKSLNQFISSGDFVKDVKRVAPSDIVYVYIKTKTSEGAKIIEPYTFKIVSEDITNKLLTAWINVNTLQQIESLDEVVSIETVVQPKVNVDSEGDQLHRANVVRGLSNGSTGKGMKVGVISDGVDHLNDSIAKGALTSQVTVLSNTVNGDEGTAMLEIVHALAPEATLYFHDCGTNTIAFNKAVDNLVAAGCNIIVDDIRWITQSFFEDDIISSHIKQVINNTGIIYTSSAGNSANSHYIGRYYNDGNNNNDFSSGKESVYKYMYVHIEPGEKVQVVLQWDDPFYNSNNDYDLYLRNTTGSIIASSGNDQNGVGSSPLECFEYTNNTSSAIDARIDVNNYNGLAAAKTLNLYIYGQNYSNNVVSSNSIYGQAAVSEVITVGAIEVSNPNQIAYYSSQGPVLQLNGVTRKKPDVCGASGVKVTGAGGFSSTFNGTSAAAPHIAAIAALLWSKYPTMTSTEIRNLIVNTSVDLGTPGYDSIFGNGRADAYNAFIVTKPVTGITLNKNTLLLQKNQSESLIPDVNPIYATNKNVIWSSSNNSVATVDSNGKVIVVGKGTAMITVTTKDGNFKATALITTELPSVSYQGHVQNIGWQDWVKDGSLAGTEGKSLRVEGFKIKLENAPVGLKIKYKTHVQNIGWQDFVYDGAMGGTEGQSLRVEALQIMLEGTYADKYSVQYQAHVQNEGWQPWVRDGQVSGSFGKSQRIEAIRVKVVERLPSVSYQGHVQNIGWQDWVKDGTLSGTEGKSLRVEGFKIKLENAPVGLKIKYKTHVQNIGWQDFVYDGAMGGTEGQSLRVEALQIMLEGTYADKYSVQYQAHVQNQGWQPWVRDGQVSGSFGKSQRIEALKIMIVEK